MTEEVELYTYETDPVLQTLREREEAREAAETYWEAWQDSAVYWKDEVRRLRTALEKYGQHLCHCRAHDFLCKLAGDCTCGLDEAISPSRLASIPPPLPVPPE